VTSLRPAVPEDEEVVAYADNLPEWAPTRALGRAVLVTGLLLIAGVLAGRVDLVVLAVPFALGTAVALHRRPRERPRIALEVDEGYVVEGADVSAAVTVGNPDPPAYDLVVVRTVLPRWVRVEDGDRPTLLTLAPGAVDQVLLRGEALRWGRHKLGPAAARAAACDGLMVSRSGIAFAQDVKVYPVTEPFDADDAMPRAAGLVGGHRSRRPGEGGELAGVRVFQPGDRLRRIDWRVSLRARQLHVAATLSDRDAELDVLAEAGGSGGVGGTASVLDTTVRAAAAIAEHYLHRGDRVSMLEYGTSARRLRPATGRRQYLTVLEWLLDVEAQPSPYEPYDQVFGPHVLSSDALVVVFTPLVDSRSAEMLARLARSGRFVLAIDTLPENATPPRRSEWTEVSHRLWRLERDNTIGQLREHGVPVVRWAGAGSLDLVLRDVARMASAPKGALR